MPYVPEVKQETPLQQVLNYSDTNPLDVLNKWRSGELDNDAFFILMQRAVLDLNSRVPKLADPEAFARQRNQMMIELPRKQMLVNAMLDNFQRIQGYKLSISDKDFDRLVTYAGQMLDAGMRYSPFCAVNLARSRYDMFMDYAGGKEFTQLLDEVINANNQ